jgi:hypothetical protein
MAASFNEVDIRQRVSYEREQGVPYREIAEHLNADGLLTKTGRPWQLYNLYFYQQPEKHQRGKKMPHQKPRKAIPVKEKPTPITPNGRIRRVSLTTIQDVRRLWASVMNDLRLGLVDPSLSSKLLYGINVGLNLFDRIDFQDQLDKLERKAGL